MFKPIELFIGLRYIRAKRRNHFISFISMMSIVGIALGVTVLITTLSVLNGFDREIKKSIFSMLAPVTINGISGQVKEWQEIEKIILQNKKITAVAPYISGQSLIENGQTTETVKIIGILPAQEKGVTALSQKMIAGSADALSAKNNTIVIGVDLAKQLAAKVGDKISLLTPSKNLSTTNMSAALNVFKVVGIFKAGGGALNYDGKLAFIHLANAQHIFNMGTNVTALHANINDIYQAPAVTYELNNQLPENCYASNWTDQLGAYFENIQLTKTIMFFIFILIIVVAIFNLVSTLIMIVNNKRADIAILRTLGASPGSIMKIFVIQGLVIGCVGSVLGVVCGVMLAENVTAIVNMIQTVFHIQFISSHIYFIDYLPSEVQWQDVLRVSITAILLSLIATLRPALKAARTAPVESLRG